MATAAIAMEDGAPKRRPRAGQVRSGYERLIKMADEFTTLAVEYKKAAAHLVMVEAGIKQAKEALEAGDEAAAKRALDEAAKEAAKARVSNERTATLADSFAGMLDFLRSWMSRAGF